MVRSRFEKEMLALTAVDVEQVISNVERGDCPQPVEKVWLIAYRDADDDARVLAAAGLVAV